MLQFVTCVAGERYQPLASVLLQSIKEVMPDSPVVVVFQDVAQFWRYQVSSNVPNAQLIAATSPIDSRRQDERIPLKLRSWRQACSYLDDEPATVFLDCDMVLVTPIPSCTFWGHRWDIGYTYKTHECEGLKWPINTGTILSQLPPALTNRFLVAWLMRTHRHLISDETLRKAIEGWGAADQAALGDMLGTRNRAAYAGIIDRQGVRFKGFPCYKLNQTACEPITEENQIIHYKGSWHKILLDGGSWSRGRPVDGV